MGQTFPYFSTNVGCAVSRAPAGDDDPCYVALHHRNPILLLHKMMARFQAERVKCVK